MNKKSLVILLAIISFMLGVEQVNALEPSCGSQSSSQWKLKDVRINDTSLGTTTTDTQKIQCCSVGLGGETYACDIYESTAPKNSNKNSNQPVQHASRGCNILSALKEPLQEVYGMLKIALPIALIIFGAIDFTTPILSNDKEALTKATGRFIRRCIILVAFFFIPTILQFIFNAYKDATGNEITLCGLVGTIVRSWR